MEALWPEFFPSTKKLKEIIKSGIIGDIKNIKVSYGSYKNEEAIKRLCNPNLGGGALLDIGIYPLSFIDIVLDDEVEFFESTYSLCEYNTDVYSKINLVYKNGCKAEVIISFLEEIEKEAFIIGTKGSIYLPNHHQNKEFIVKTDKEIKYSFPFEINGFEYQIREAIDCINNHKNESSIYDSGKSIKLMKLLYDIRMSFNIKYDFE